MRAAGESVTNILPADIECESILITNVIGRKGSEKTDISSGGQS